MADEHEFRTITDWPQVDPATGEAIRAFWLREAANVEGDEATRRLAQVVAHVVDKHGEVVALATVVPKVLPRLGQPMYYYRCFVGKAGRTSKLIRPLLSHTQKVLERYARAHDFPCIGILLELENKGFNGALRWANWHGVNFSYIGISPRGLELRVWYFRGARLKTREQMAKWRAAAAPMQKRPPQQGRVAMRQPGAISPS